jgi:hypothetical protein
MSHTPGPWESDSAKDGESRYHQIDAPTPNELVTFPYTVADTMNRHHCVTPHEDAANARLIAAAPELLAALKDVREYYGPSEYMPQVDAAIAKAEGRSL